MNEKITKAQFLELVDLAIAVHGFEKLWELGYNEGREAHEESLDQAVADYVFWTYDNDGTLREGNGSWGEWQRVILNHWTKEE